MATNISSISLLDTAEFAKRMSFNRPFAISNFLEPILTAGNIVRQTMLGAPFAWWWNSKPVNFVCDPNQNNPQDYIVPAPTFGWIESAAVQDIGQNPAKWYQMNVKMSLSIDNTLARPSFISPLNQDTDTGDVTFRLMPSPAKAYPVNMVVQQAAPLFTKLSQTWQPIPDYLSFVFSWGVLSILWAFADDARWTMANQKFISGLLSAAQGLDEVSVNAFMNTWGDLTSQQKITTQQGNSARGI